MSGLVPPAESMDAWIGRLMTVRRRQAPGSAEVIDAARRAAGDMVATGTVLVGDISNTLISPPVLHDVGLGGIVFHEVLGFGTMTPVELVGKAAARLGAAMADVGSDLRSRVVAHAPYSVSPALFQEIVRREDTVPLTVHLGESPEEVEFLRTGDGPIRRMLEDLGVWSDTWPLPACDPVEYMRRLGYLQPGLLAVHATHITDDGLTRLREAGAVVVTCPRSNVWVGVGLPRVSHFYANGVPVAIGTDSLASVATLNMFDELAELRRIAPDVAAGALLDSATRVGAEALGFGATHGTLAPGKSSRIVAVHVPGDVSDVEEYLVSGVSAQSVHPLS
jgi:cytosine/adenosine deaminase-related metal-dependent hydrolase